MGVYYDGRFANKELSAEEADKLFLKAKARKLLEDVGGAANWRDAKTEWDDNQF